jgi:hypothetical protein
MVLELGEPFTGADHVDFGGNNCEWAGCQFRVIGGQFPL